MDEDIARLRVVNLGIQAFFDALVAQGAPCVQLDWTPPARQDAETEALLDQYL